mgnify:CR=1 FL=1
MPAVNIQGLGTVAFPDDMQPQDIQQAIETDILPKARPTMMNTKLEDADEQDFQQWKAANSPDDSGYDYDLRGAYLADKAGQLPKKDGRGHGTDWFKKPWHPTYSDQSHIKDPGGLAGGKWSQDEQGRTVFTAGPANLAYNTPADLMQYFEQREPNAVLNIPGITNQTQVAVKQPLSSAEASLRTKLTNIWKAGRDRASMAIGDALDAMAPGAAAARDAVTGYVDETMPHLKALTTDTTALGAAKELAEGAAQFGTGFAGGIAGGLGGLVDLARNAKNAALNPESTHASNPTDTIQQVAETLTYEPRTEGGKAIAEIGGAPFVALGKAADWVAGKGLDLSAEGIGAAHQAGYLTADEADMALNALAATAAVADQH